jgi:hypothetical protein
VYLSISVDEDTHWAAAGLPTTAKKTIAFIVQKDVLQKQ